MNSNEFGYTLRHVQIFLLAYLLTYLHTVFTHFAILNS